MRANKSLFKISVQDFLFALEAFICWHFSLKLLARKFAQIYFIIKVKTTYEAIIVKAFST